MILRGVQGRRDRACDQLLSRAQREEGRQPGKRIFSLCPATSAQSSGACNAKRDRTHPPFVRPPNNTLVSSAAASSFPSAFLHRTAPPPPHPPFFLPSPPPPSSLCPSCFSISSSLLISSSFHLAPFVRCLPLSTRPHPRSLLPAKRSPKVFQQRLARAAETKDNQDPLTRRPILLVVPCRFGVINRRRMARKSGRRRY